MYPLEAQQELLTGEPSVHLFNKVAALNTEQLSLTQGANLGWQRHHTLKVTPGLVVFFFFSFCDVGIEHRALHLLGISSIVD